MSCTYGIYVFSGVFYLLRKPVNEKDTVDWNKKDTSSILYENRDFHYNFD